MTKLDGQHLAFTANSTYEFLSTDVKFDDGEILISWHERNLGYGETAWFILNGSHFLDSYVTSDEMSVEFMRALLVEVAPKFATFFVTQAQ